MFARRGPEAELKRCGDIGLGSGCQQRNPPAFVLDVAGESETRSRENIGVDCHVILATTIRNVAGVQCSVAKFESDFAARTEPVIGANLLALC